MLNRYETAQNDQPELKPQFLEMVFAGIADGVIVADAEQHITFLNDAARELLGRREDEDIAIRTVDVRFSDGRPTPYEEMPLARGLRGEKFKDYEIVLHRPDGTKKFIKTSGGPLTGPNGRIAGAVVVMHDLTSEREILDQLEEQRSKLEQIVDSLPEGFLIVEGDSAEIRVVNRAARTLLGLDVGCSLLSPMILGRIFKPDGQMMRPEELPVVLTLKHGTPQKDQHLMVITTDGRRVDILTDTVPLLDQKARVTGAAALLRDISSIRAEHERLQRNYEREHHLAEILQRSLLPAESLELNNFDIAAEYRPAMEIERVGGDFYDSFSLPDGRAVICIGDVSGKGVEAAVFTSLARDCIRAYILECPRPASVLRRLNNTLLTYIPEDYFVTVFLAILDSERRKLTYASAGHDPPLLCRCKGKKVFEVRIPGRLAGVYGELKYQQKTITLYPGDILFLYTDGLVEARRNGDVLGAERLGELLKQHGDKSPSEMINAIYVHAKEFAGGSLYDDAAAILVKVL